jgi:hypothetical protein
MVRIASVRGSAGQRLGQNGDEAPGFVPAFLVEQLLALIDGEEDCPRRRIVGRCRTSLSDVAQGRKEPNESVTGLFDEVLDVGAASRQAPLSDPVGKVRLSHDLLQGLGEPVLDGDRRALGPEDWERQSRLVVASEARP